MRILALTLTLVAVLAGAVLAQENNQQDSETAPPQPPPLTLERAWQLAPQVDAGVISAKADLDAAERDLARVEADPLALRLEKVQARQGLESARSSYDIALLTTRIDVASAYFDALEASDALARAELQQGIAEATLEATRIRLEAGAATQLDLERARNDLASAERGLADARLNLDLAILELGSLLGQTASDITPLETTFDESRIPTLEQVQAEAAESNAQLASAARAVELAEVRLAAIDNAFSARADIDAARDTLENARTSQQDTRRSLELTVQGSYNSLLGALGRYQSALESYRTSVDDLAAQKTRLEAGSISPLSYRQNELNHASTEASLRSAHHDLELALLQLERTVMGSGGP